MGTHEGEGRSSPTSICDGDGGASDDSPVSIVSIGCRERFAVSDSSAAAPAAAAPPAAVVVAAAAPAVALAATGRKVFPEGCCSDSLGGEDTCAATTAVQGASLLLSLLLLPTLDECCTDTDSVDGGGQSLPFSSSPSSGRGCPSSLLALMPSVTVAAVMVARCAANPVSRR